MKRNRLIAAGFILIIVIIFGALIYRTRSLAADMPEVSTVTAELGDLTVTVAADGTVRSNQSALMVWNTSGTVARVHVKTGDRVQKGDVLAELDPESLPPQVVLAQAELIQARRALDDLLQSRARSAEALKAVESARKALEDARSPVKARGEAQQSLAEAEAALEDAQMRYEIAVRPASQAASEQAYSSLLLAENALNKHLEEIARVEKKLKRPESAYSFWESKGLYQRILDALELQLPQKQIAYEEALQRYQRLQQPPDPNDVARAEAELALAQAQVEQARRRYERVKDGASAGELAVLQAELEDAEREYARWKDGPSEDEILAAEARIAAAEALLDATRITATFDGVVTQVHVQPGDRVDPGTAAFRVDDLSRFIVEAQVSEVDINKVKPGQKVLLRFDAVDSTLLGEDAAAPSTGTVSPGTYTGEVVQVVPVGQVTGGTTTYTVRTELVADDGLVRPGMTAEISIVIEELQDVLLVPSQAIRFENGRRVVYILKGSEMVPVEITLGATSRDFSQVLAGDIRPGDPVVVSLSQNPER